MLSCRAILFDLDDTLYPERDFVLSGFRAVAAWAGDALGIPPAEGFATLRDLFAAGVRGDTFTRWLDQWFVADSGTIVTQLVDIYRKHVPDIQPFTGVPQFLDSLGQAYSLGLVSDGYLSVQQNKLAALNLGQYFDAVVFSDELGRAAWKPSSKPFELICQRLALPPENCVYVADNATKDFAGARALGMKTIWLRRPAGEYAALMPPQAAFAPDLEIGALYDLPGALTRLFDSGTALPQE